jgi:hypothetical protein
MMRRSLSVGVVLAVFVMGLRVADAQIPVTDSATTMKNVVTAALKSQILDTLTEQARQIRRMARRLSVFTDLAKYAVADPTRWRSYRYQDVNLYANPYVEALNGGDPDGTAYKAIARTRTDVETVLAALGEDGPVPDASLAAALATLDLADSSLITGTDQNGRLRAGGKREMRAVDSLERDVADGASTQSATAVADKISAAVLLENRNRQARLQVLTAMVEQLLVDNKRSRDAETAAMNMQLGRLRDGRTAGLGLLSGAGNDLRTWKQP